MLVTIIDNTAKHRSYAVVCLCPLIEAGGVTIIPFTRDDCNSNRIGHCNYYCIAPMQPSTTHNWRLKASCCLLFGGYLNLHT